MFIIEDEIVLTTYHLEGAFTVFFFGLIVSAAVFILEILSQWKYVLQLKEYLSIKLKKLFNIKETEIPKKKKIPVHQKKVVTFQVNPVKRNYARMLKKRHYL